MKLQFLGTSAAEGIPALFCNCPACQYAYKTGGKEIRMRAGAMLDDVIKIDFGPDSYAQMLANHLDYTRVHALLVTHSHPDHLAVDELGYRQPSFSHLTDERMLTVYGNAAVGKKIAPRLSARIGFQQLTAFETVEIEGYQVTPLQAVHYLHREPNPPQENLVTFEGKTYSRMEQAFIYLIEKEGKRLLYAHDCAGFTAEDLDFLAGKRLDLVTLDCTYGGNAPKSVGHMGYAEDLKCREQLKQRGAADDKTIFVANHFSHNGVRPYADMQALLPGFIISYDGMVIEF